jgi:hypothetical protein
VNNEAFSSMHKIKPTKNRYFCGKFDLIFVESLIFLEIGVHLLTNSFQKQMLLTFQEQFHQLHKLLKSFAGFIIVMTQASRHKKQHLVI